LPHLVDLAEQYADRPVTVVSIDAGGRSEAASAFLDENNVRHVVLNDKDRSAFAAYHVSAIPMTVIIDHAGRLMFRHVGFSPGTEKRFSEEIETLLGWIGEA
jgi:peroxiredoxin